jgi:maltooligosyltrehalose trehalohydrolase
MGEEWGASSPFLFFTDHVEPHHAQGESERREREFVGFGYDDWGATAPDPQDEATFHRSKLDWSELSSPGHEELLGWYRDLIALRKANPDLADPRLDRVSVETSEEGRWIVVHRGALRVAANLGDFSVAVPLAPGTVLLASDPKVSMTGADITLPAHSLAVVRPD